MSGAAVAQLRDARCDGVVAFGGGSVLDAAKAVALLVANPEQTLGDMTEHSELQPTSAADCGADHRRHRVRNYQRDGDY
ncbi:ethanolamine utilization protein EutG [Klebsiella aerogenes]|nr:ethanolamine utilization protein EutG [Klebsiella aerogenes]